MKKNPLIKMFKTSLINLPTPNNISLYWNFGSLLGICLLIQLISGLFLTMYYYANTSLAFESIIFMMNENNYGWMIRSTHANGASFFFLMLYFHVGRGLYFYSYMNTNTWIIGVLLLIISMMTAFLGYVLPWGQMSFWGASVITGLLSAIPYLGADMMQWIWAGFSINNSTLSRFYSIHFLLPFIISMMVLIHLMFLHNTGSSNPLGINSNFKKISFYPYYLYKDLVGFLIMFFILMILIFYNPYYLSDPDNFIPANPLITPIHIQPEWYFLFAYAILRSIPNKLGGVIALLMSIMILMFLPLMNNFFYFKSNQFYSINKLLYWFLIFTITLLTWIGMQPVEIPYIIIGQILTIIYFSLYLIMPLTSLMWNNLIN